MASVSTPGRFRPRAPTLIDPFELKPHAFHESPAPPESAARELTPVDASVRPTASGVAPVRPPVDSVDESEPDIQPARASAGPLSRRWPLLARSPRARGWCSEE
jgi:hypothetical protein